MNDKQELALRDIVKRNGNVDVTGANYDLRTINALVRRDFVKITENKKGTFVKATAKGKKAIN